MGKTTNTWDVIVIGAGAAGILAAGRAAQQGAKVLLLEKMRQPGRKLLITGKGRCNITHDAPLSEYWKNIFPNGRFLKHALHAFFKDDILQILHDRGVETTTERGSRVFPVSNDAKEVLNALLDWMGTKNIERVFNVRVNQLIIDSGQVKGVRAMTDQGTKEFYAQSVIIATGGKSYPATGSTGDGYELAKQAGHTITQPQPALVPLVTREDYASNLQGLGLKNINAVVWVNGKKTREEFGELMFAHYGLTGPVILTLSRNVVEEISAGNNVEISIDLKPALDEKKLDARLLRDLNEHGKKQVENIFKLWLPSSLIPVFLEILELDGKKLCNQLGGKERKKILLLMKDFRFTITGHPGFKEAIITAGGVPTSEIQSKTMESKLVKNLFFAGEVIDLDANTGGFNLQIAWSTGWLAGQESVPKS
ncbi:MAG: NAD(P)/FAD-dependent oxidoreductase [Bacteroidales bacterium]|nr:NAD(P)/FAD-dependent oxidoreductase [Bacteroidales bacterium]